MNYKFWILSFWRWIVAYKQLLSVKLFSCKQNVDILCILDSGSTVPQLWGGNHSCWRRVTRRSKLPGEGVDWAGMVSKYCVSRSPRATKYDLQIIQGVLKKDLFWHVVILTQYRLCRVLYSLHKKGDNRVLYIWCTHYFIEYSIISIFF